MSVPYELFEMIDADKDEIYCAPTCTVSLLYQISFKCEVSTYDISRYSNALISSIHSLISTNQRQYSTQLFMKIITRILSGLILDPIFE